MELWIQILIGLHLLVNGFLIGMHFGDSFQERTWVDIPIVILGSVIALEFILICVIGGYVWDFIKWVLRTFQIVFYFKFYFTKQYTNLTPAELKNIDLRYEVFTNRKKEGKKLTLAQEELILCCELVYKRSGHKPKTEKEYNKEELKRDRVEFKEKQIVKWRSQNPDMLEEDMPTCIHCNSIMPPHSLKSCHWCGENQKSVFSK